MIFQYYISHIAVSYNSSSYNNLTDLKIHLIAVSFTPLSNYNLVTTDLEIHFRAQIFTYFAETTENSTNIELYHDISNIKNFGLFFFYGMTINQN